MAFDAAFTFVYSSRAGTVAAALPEQVPDEIRRERVRRLIAATQGVAPRRAALIGRAAEVLIEGRGRDGQRLRGRTRQNVTVNVTGAADRELSRRGDNRSDLYDPPWQGLTRRTRR